jgi:hypothetical protein
MAGRLSAWAVQAAVSTLALGAVVVAAWPAAAAGQTLAAQEVFGTVKAVTPATVVISHITTGRAVKASTLTYSTAGTSVTAPDHWVLEKDTALQEMLKNPFFKKLLKASPPASTLLSKLRNPSTPSMQSKVWVNRWGSVPTSYLAPGDVVHGVSALSAANTADYELTGKAVPLATINDNAAHTPAPAPTLAEKLEAKLFALDLASLTR